jgi:hypothetical protein
MRSIGSNFQKAAASLLISQRWRAAKCVFDSSNGASEFLKYALSSESDQFEVAVVYLCVRAISSIIKLYSPRNKRAARLIILIQYLISSTKAFYSYVRRLNQNFAAQVERSSDFEN